MPLYGSICQYLEPTLQAKVESRMQALIPQAYGRFKFQGTFMQVNLRHKGSITILDIEGKVIGADALGLKAIIDEQIQIADSQTDHGGHLNLILNMERIQMMDSSGLGVLVAAYTSIQRNEGRVVLLNLGGNIRSLIVMAKLMTIFDCYNSEAEAIAGIMKS